MFTTSLVQLRLELLLCDSSFSLNAITNTFVGLKCLTETKIQILYDNVDYTRFHIVEMGCQMVKDDRAFSLLHSLLHQELAQILVLCFP